MPDENSQILAAMFEALREGGVEAMLAYIHEDGEMITPAELASEPDTYKGHDGLRRYFDSFYDAMDVVTVKMLNPEPIGSNQVVAFIELRTRGRTTGIVSGLDVELLSAFKDGKVRKMRFFATREEARTVAASA